MFRLVEKARKNNKGFSLVELIVVVLIIAIIAVALAPQVVKYVGKARTSVEANNAATLKSAVQAAVAEYQSQVDVKDLTTVTYNIDKNSTVSVSGNDTNKYTTETDTQKNLMTLIQANVGHDKLDKTHVISIDNKGTVTIDPKTK